MEFEDKKPPKKTNKSKKGKQIKMKSEEDIQPLYLSTDFVD